MKPSPYGPFPYSPVNRRAKLELPGGARVALWVVSNVEFFALDKPMPGDSNERPKPTDHTPMVRHWAQRDYGNRVGVYRLMELLGAHGIRSASRSMRACATTTRASSRIASSSAGR
jgi:hypothetical protein